MCKKKGMSEEGWGCKGFQDTEFHAALGWAEHSNQDAVS